MLNLTAFEPSCHLKPYVQRYILTEGHIPKGTELRHLLIPGITEIVYFNLSENPQTFVRPGAEAVIKNGFVAGQLSQAFEGIFSGHVKLLGIHMHTPAMYQLFGVPVKLMLNGGLQLEDVIGSKATHLCHEIQDMKCISLVIKKLETFLTGLLRNTKITAHSVLLGSLDAIVNANGNSVVKCLANDNNISIRTLQKIFLNHVGLTPKEYSRMYRFGEVIRAVNANKFSWRYAVEHLGFYDQAHFLNDFKSITGLSPSDYLQLHPFVNKFITDYK